MNFDLDSLEKSAQATFNVDVGEREDGQKVGFVVVGQGSSQYTEADREVQVLNITEAAKRKKPIATDTPEGALQVVDGGEIRVRVQLQKCVVAWYGFQVRGEAGSMVDAEFNQENLARVLKAKPNWAKLLAVEIDNDANFVSG